MIWLIPSLIASFVSSLMMFFAFLYLYVHEERKYLALWSASWAIYSIRFVFEILPPFGTGQGFIFALNQLCSLWSGALLLWGTYLFSGRKLHRAWFTAFLAATVWIGVAVVFGFGFIWTTSPTFLIMAVANVATGVVLLRFKEVRGIAKAAAGWSFILWGLHKADYPFLRPVVWLAPWGYLLGTSLAFVSSLCVILMYFLKAKEDVKATEEKYRSIFDNSPDGIFQTTPDGRFLSANPTLARMYAYETPQELMATVTRIEDQLYVDPADRLKLKRAYEKEGSVTDFETSIRRKDGAVVWVSMNARAIRDEAGRIVCYEGTVQDVTERRQAQEAFKERLEFETLLGGLSRRFINIPTHLLEREMEEALRSLCLHFGFNRCGVWQQYREDPVDFQLTYIYRPAGQQPPSPVATAAVSVPWSLKRILEGEILVIPSVADLPAEAARDREFCAQIGVRSFLVVPLVTGDRPSGALSFEITDNEREWPEELVQQLRLVAEILANALARKHSEEVLRESEERFRSTFDQAPVGIAHVTPDGCFIRLNDRFCQIVGYSREEMLNLTFHDITYADNLEETIDKVRRLLEGSIDKYVMEKRYRRKDGSLVWVNATVSLLRKPTGEPGYLVCAVEDITERRLALEALRQSELKYRRLYESITDAIASVNMEGRIIEFNPAFAALVRYPDDELMHLTYRDLTPERWHDTEAKIVTEQVLRRGYSDVYEKEYRRKDGAVIPVELRTFLIRDESDRPTGIWAIVRDITERKQAEQEKQLLESQLHQSQKMEAIGTLAGGVAHDFNNILTAIIGFASIVQMDLGGDDPKSVYIDQILSSSQKAANLTQSLLAFSRKQKIDLKPHRMNDIIEQTTKLLKRLLTEDIILNIRLDPGNPVILADITQIDQILINLATNARDAMPKGGTLKIETGMVILDEEFIKLHGYGRPGEYAMLSVSDNGIGMDESIKEHIFEPFFTTKEVGRGTGLGLSTVYGVVKQHNGYITVDSTQNRGTTFQMYFPVAHLQEEMAEDRATDIPRGSETVLVAEDDPAVRRLVVDILKRYGYGTVEAVDGQEALKKFIDNKEKINLIIMDVVMPKMNGKEVYDQIRTANPNIRVLFTSGYTRDVIVDRGVEDSLADFIKKPIQPLEFLRKVREILDR